MKTTRLLLAATVVCVGWAAFAQGPVKKTASPEQKSVVPPSKTEPSAKAPPPKPGDTKAVETKAVDAKATDPKPTNPKPKDSKPVDVAPTVDPAEAEKADEKAIRQSAEEYVKLYNAHDAKGLSEMFALKAEITDEEGELIKGREAIEQDFTRTFTEYPNATIQIKVGSVRLLTPNIAIEEGAVQWKLAPDQGEQVDGDVGYVAIHVKVDGKFLIASVSNFETPVELTPHDHLQELAWMVGDWIEEGADAHIKSSCHWDPSGNYLLHDFAVHFPGGANATGSIRIGWDPQAKQLKSWTFEADGAHSEGLWTRVENQWIVKSHGVNARGEATSSTNIYRAVDRDTMVWSSDDRIAGGNLLDSVPEIIVKRHAPPPEH